MSKGFTQIDNTILDIGLSMEALGLYIQIKRHITKKNWEIKREYCKSISGMGETAFRRVWKELQDNGLLLSECTRVGGKFQYNFSLKCSLNDDKKEKAPTTKAPAKKKVSKKKDKDQAEKVEILEGQVSVEEVLEAQEPTDSEAQKPSDIKEPTDVEKVVNATGCTMEKAEEVLAHAVANKKNNPVGFAISAINGNWKLGNKETNGVSQRNEVNPIKFNNFKGRDYDFDRLEAMLLGDVDYSEEDMHEVLSNRKSRVENEDDVAV